MSKKPESPGKTDDEDEIDENDFQAEDSTENIELEDTDIEKKEQDGKIKKSESVFNGDMDATRLYLAEIGFSPLLTAEEEVYFSRKALKGYQQILPSQVLRSISHI